MEQTLPYDPSWRPKAGSDYLVLSYDAAYHHVHWFDYKHQGPIPILVDRNGSFLPVVYSREKVLVHVCGLHPTDTVSISTNDVVVPEQGADIRGTMPSNATALAPTLDTLGTASAAGTAFGPAGFSFASLPGVAALQTSLFTAGSSKDGTTYSDATLNVDPEDLALETVVVYFNARDAIKTIDELSVGYTPDKAPEQRLFPDCPAQPAPPGSICQLQAAAHQLKRELEGTQGGRHSYTSFSNQGDDSLGGFNYLLAQTQTLVTQMNGLAAGVSQAGLPARVFTLRQNLEAIVGVVDQVQNLIVDDAKFSNNPVYGPTDTSKKTPPPPQQAYKNPGTPGATCSDLANAISKKTTLFTKTKNGYEAYSPPDSVTCHAMELYVMKSFNCRFLKALNIYGTIATRNDQAELSNLYGDRSFRESLKSLADLESSEGKASSENQACSSLDQAATRSQGGPGGSQAVRAHSRTFLSTLPR